MPVFEDEKRVNVVLRYPAGLAELEQKGERWARGEDSERGKGREAEDADGAMMQGGRR